MERKENDNEREEDVQQTQLPNDVITQQILPWLPIKPLTQCKLISKLRNSTISNPNFILNHFQKTVFKDPFSPLETLFIKSGLSYYLYSCNDEDNNVENNELVKLDNDGGDMIVDDNSNDVHVVGSSNGLVCLAANRCNYFTLWNPTTNQSHNYYPDDFELLNSYHSDGRATVSWGFGYASSLNDYRVVRVMFRWNEAREFVRSVHVFSLRSNTWKKIDFGLVEDKYFYLMLRRPRLVDESLYWHALNEMFGGVIVVFDLVLETFHMLPRTRLNLHKHPKLCTMGGWLSVVTHSTPDLEENDLLVYILKQQERVVSVRLQCGRGEGKIEDLIGFTKTGKILAACSSPNRLCSVDPYSMKTLVTFEDERGSSIDSYVPSQISPLPPVEPPTGTFGQVG